MSASSHGRSGLLYEASAVGSRRNPAIYGAWAAAYLLATTKWGSYAGIAPIYLADLLIAAAFWQLLTARKDSDLNQRPMLTTTQVSLLLALPLWATVRLLASQSYGFNTFRDYAPYLYASVALIAAVGVSRSTSQQRRWTAKLIWIALLFHLAWTLAVVIAPDIPNALPVIGNGVRLFSPREDIDSAYLGVTATVALFRWSSTKKLYNLMIAITAIAAVMQISSRAGLIAAFFCMAIAAYFIIRNSRASVSIALVATLGPIALIASFKWLLELPAIARLIATAWPSLVSNAEDGYASAQGTTDARRQAWSAAINYTNEFWERLVFGAGFGSDFMAESGAARLLLGPLAADSGVRSPHNYYIGTYARLGLIGLCLVVALTVVSLAIVILSRRLLASEELGVLVSAIVLAVVPTALFGVTLESPFGSIPFFWAVGALIGYSRLPANFSNKANCSRQQGMLE